MMINTKILKVDDDPFNETLIDRAVLSLKKGGIVAFPTDTFYALGADSSNLEAFEKIFEIKKRERSKPVILLANGITMIRKYVTGFDDMVLKLSRAFLPGKLTMVFNPDSGVSSHLVGANGKIAFRVPDSLVCEELISRLGAPLTGTSANFSGMEPSRSAGEVMNYFEGRIDLILDGGCCGEKEVSTIIDVTKKPPEILRPGAITEREIEDVISC